VIAAIIEWSSFDIATPVLVLTGSIETTCQTVVEYLRDTYADDGYVDDPHFIEEHPYPDTNDHDAVRRWLLAMREATPRRGSSSTCTTARSRPTCP
jgi:hypothetical protein